MRLDGDFPGSVVALDADLLAILMTLKFSFSPALALCAACAPGNPLRAHLNALERPDSGDYVSKRNAI